VCRRADDADDADADDADDARACARDGAFVSGARAGGTPPLAPAAAARALWRRARVEGVVVLDGALRACVRACVRGQKATARRRVWLATRAEDVGGVSVFGWGCGAR
jgi:hypothetical protein